MIKLRKKLTIGLLTIFAISCIIWLINKIIFLVKGNDFHGYEGTSYYYEWKFGKLHYSVYGEGKPLLLLHSTHNGASGIEFNKLISKLSSKRTVYVLNLLGYGQSDKPRFTYTAYLYVQLISDFIKNVIKQPCDVITSGQSNAFISMLTLQDNEIVKRMIFINPTDIDELSRNPTNTDKLIKYLIESPILGTLIYNIISSKKLITKQFKELYLQSNTSLYTNYVDSFYKSTHSSLGNNRYSFASNYCKYNNVNIKNAIASINHSIYIIQGGDVNRNIEKIYADYKKLNPSIEYTIINNCREFPHIENPYETYKAIDLYIN